MRHLPRPGSRVFRAVLALALLAWMTLAIDAFASPLAMLVGKAASPEMTTDKAAPAHCEGMTMAHASFASHAAPSHLAGGGHGCCQTGGCHCASSCNGIVGVPFLSPALEPAHVLAPTPIRSEPLLAHSAPPLRPPIA